MVKKTDRLKIRILELIALLGEATSDEIKSFSNSPSYAEKLITSMKKEAYIKSYRKENKSTLRLMSKGKKLLSDSLPELFGDSFKGQKSMNRVRDDKRREERRSKLVELLLMFHRADTIIFPDEKIFLKNNSVITEADTTDITDKYRPEFYTSLEIKNVIPDYKKGIGSRTLGILISYGKLYIVYLTADGNLHWRKDTEKDFLTNTKNILARRLFGKDNGTYLLVISENKKVPSIIMKRKDRSGGKIHPSSELPNMIFSLKDSKKDQTLDFILSDSELLDRLEAVFKADLTVDKKDRQYDGVIRTKVKDALGNIVISEIFGICAFRFDLRKIMDGVYSAARAGKKVMIFCFDYQREYIEIFLKELKQDKNQNIEILSNSIEGYKENYLS